MTIAVDLKNRFLDALSFVISGIFSPYLLSVFFVLAVAFISTVDVTKFLPWILVGLFFLAAVPIIYIFWLHETDQISDLHMSNHQERKLPFLVSAVSALIGVIILFLMHAATPILAVTTAYAVNALVICGVTLYWKISIHSASFAASALILMLFFGAKFWPLFLFWIPLAWARVHRKKHTPDQVLAGAVLATLLTIIVFYAFGYKIGG
ncbi:MAG TPA: phosphatase PAP2 family protein [Patescibacteria group bacterium]|nr:phosphatase PAP2 family protein [Patescibacteria group bacterium]